MAHRRAPPPKDGANTAYAIGKGRLVAARIVTSRALAADGNEELREAVNVMGDPGFVLIEHDKEGTLENKKFYSLYMHLAPLDVNAKAEKLHAGMPELQGIPGSSSRSGALCPTCRRFTKRLCTSGQTNTAPFPRSKRAAKR